jgi:CheY-like chemotaxis protein
MNTEPAAPARGKIMVVDDNLVVQRAIHFALRDQGYIFLMCKEVLAAINLIRDERPDLILVDLSFPLESSYIGGPVQDGFFFIRWVRRTPEIKTTPVIVISATEPAKYQGEIAGLDIKACLRKPLKKEELIAAIQPILDGSAASQPAAPESGMPPPQPAGP